MRVCPHCSSDVPDGPTCGRCGETLPGRGISPWPIFKLLGCLGLLGVLAAIALPGLMQPMRASNDRNASASLKTLATAEADFRSNDRDGNHVNDYWTGDVAGLFCIAPGEGKPDPTNAIKLIEVSIAGADSNPLAGARRPPYVPVTHFLRACPKAGYWYWALRQDASASPPALYRTEPEDAKPAERFYNSDRFGFIAYPDTMSSGKAVFIINESNTMFQRPNAEGLRPSSRVPPGPLLKEGYLDWPSDATLKRDWSRLE